MTYEELANKLNEKYNTHIFYAEYPFTIGEEKEIQLAVNIPSLKGLHVTVNVDTLDMKDLFRWGGIDVSALVKLSKSDDQTIQIEQQTETIKNLRSKIEDMQEEIVKVEALKSVRDFAQETILKAIAK